MKCISALSTARTTNAAFHQILERLDEGMAEEKADLTVLFSSMHHADELGRISAAFLEQGRTRHVLGCTGETIIGEDREIEGSPALAAWSITLPGVSIEPVRLGEPGEAPTAWAEDLDDPAKAVMLLLGDPFSFQTDDFLKQLNAEVRGLRVVGGMASGSQVPRANQLVLDGKAYHDGAVAMLLSGPVRCGPSSARGAGRSAGP